jgi:hypothetical protein
MLRTMYYALDVKHAGLGMFSIEARVRTGNGCAEREEFVFFCVDDRLLTGECECEITGL